MWWSCGYFKVIISTQIVVMWWSCCYFKVIISTQIVVMWWSSCCFKVIVSTQTVVMWWSCGYCKVIFLIEEKYKTRRSNISFIDLLLDRAFLNSIFLDAFLQKSECVRTRSSARSNLHTNFPCFIRYHSLSLLLLLLLL